MRSVSPQGLQLIKGEEGKRLTAYRDAVGVWTIGYGHTKGVKEGWQITDVQAEQYLRSDAQDTIRTIYDAIPAQVVDGLPQACFDALVSFVFNVGRQAFWRADRSHTDFWRAVMGNDLTDVARQMQRWVKGRVGGKLVVLPGLVRRRGKEAAMWGAGLRQADSRIQSASVTEQDLADDATVQPEEPRRKLSEHPAAVAATGASAAGVGAAATALTAAGQGMTYSGDHVALIIGLALILVGAGLLVWMSRR